MSESWKLGDETPSEEERESRRQEREQKAQIENERWGKIQSLIASEEQRQNRTLSPFEKLELIRHDEGRDWDTLADIRRLGATGFFAAMARNTDGYAIGEIKNGEIFTEDPAYINNLHAYAAVDSGRLFDSGKAAQAWVREKEQE